MPSQRELQALEYAARGWRVFPLKASTDNRDGKTPRRGLPWRSVATTDQATIHEWWSEDDYGVGVATGESGLVVIDVDIEGDKNGYLALGALGLPATYAVRTPRGGLHLYFEADGQFPIGNSKGSDPHGLAPGIDVRGIGGYVCAPGTVLDLGVYQAVSSVPVAQLPGVLQRRLSEPSAVEAVPVAERPARPVPGGYVGAAVAGAVRDYANAEQGEGERKLVAGLCRVFELANAEWSGLDVESAVWEFDQARLQRLHAIGAAGHGQSEQDFERVIRSAVRRVGATAAPFPQQRKEMTIGGVPLSEYGGRPGALAAPDGRTQTAGPSLLPSSVPDEPDETLAQFMAEFISTRAGLEAIRPPAWLIEGWLPEESSASIVGASNSFKSFVALDMACCVATGLPWHGCEVKQGLILLVVAEGSSETFKRIRAWEQHRGVALPDGSYRIIQRPVLARTAEWDLLVRAAEQWQPALTVIDTRARTIAGWDENLSSDMGMYIAQLDRIKFATNSCVMDVHHEGRAGEQAGGRGSTAPYGAMDTEINVKRENDQIVVKQTKQKGSPEIELPPLRAEVIDLGDDENHEPITSLVMVDIVVTLTGELLGRRAPIVERMRLILDILDLYPADEEFTRTKIRTQIGAMDHSERRKFNRAFTELVNMDILRQTGGGRTNPSYERIALNDRQPLDSAFEPEALRHETET